MTINSKKALIEKFEQGFKLEINRKFRSYSYYVTNYKDTEIAVSRKVVDTMRLEGLIDSNEDYLPKPTTNGGNQ